MADCPYCAPDELCALHVNQAVVHELSSTGTSRGHRGRRQIYYGHCSCGAGTTNSASLDSVRRKIAAHVAGDDRGMVPNSRRPA